MPREVGDESPASPTVSFATRQIPEDDDVLHYADSPTQISAAPVTDVASASETGEDDVEFAFAVMDPDASPRVAADDIFFDGQIRSVYPIFDRGLLADSSQEGRTLRRLLIEERETTVTGSFSSPPSVDELEGIPEGTYCLWNPRRSPLPPDRCGKSGSTGTSRRWRVRDLVRRSQSDGRERFLFLKKGKGKGEVEIETDTCGRALPGRKGKGEEAKVAAGRRKSFLPYKVAILGFISNVNAVGRIHHPF
ncbi:hypothetical protein HPP92_024375 [Vanilla planifolia]|uniref:Uncharacterized protein n=1 Tax=Vanilla planifolia TaxID=51239 RepID=A0A835PS36_VANPL|nr:hypothetical protein HPP92_024719 [Vanilla planifolia]KAG0456587.1 hypothetical protein HPP92_024375 [Vanilla planifolia]